MGQQFYVIRNNPAPNTEAFRAKERRDADKRRRRGEPEIEADGTTIADEAPEKPAAPTRQQPKKQSRSQRKSGGRPNPPNPQKKTQKPGNPAQKPKPKPTTEQGETA
jgi:YidC/Oxa1 family membrane protein insertase